MTKLPREGWDAVDARNEEARRVTQKTDVPPPSVPVAPVYGGPPPRFEAQLPPVATVYGGPPPEMRRRGVPPIVIVGVVAAVALVAALVMRGCIV